MSLQAVELISILGTLLVAALILLLLRERAQRSAGKIAGAAAALSLAASLALIPALTSGEVPTFATQWIPAANIQLGFRLDWLSLPFLITTGVVTLVAMVYAWGYHQTDKRSAFFYALLMLFALGMAGTDLADDVFLFYVFWELMLVASCILIAIWGTDERRRSAVALKYFIFTHMGSLMVLVGLLVLYDAAGTASLSEMSGGVALSPPLFTTVTVLFITGFCVKMAIFPLHLWLPDAHGVAPMPVTIMLAAAMLSMGAYGILRFPFSIFTPQQMLPFTMPMMIAGVVSEIYGALMALVERDIKRIIAYSSVSQMGYILFGLGTLTAQGISGSIMHVIFHAIVKALLFMCVGLVIRATGRRRMTDLRGLGRALPLTAICTGVGALAIAGTPPLCLFDSEWMIFAGGFQTTHIGVSIATLFGSLLTVAYALWFVGHIFFGSPPDDIEIQPLPKPMLVPTVFLAGLSLVAGLFPSAVFNWATQALTLILGGSL